MYPQLAPTELIGRTVAFAAVEEMAFFGEEDCPAFSHPDLDFIQAQVVWLELEDGRAVTFQATQDVDEWFLDLYPSEPGRARELKISEANSIFRARSLPEFPHGTIHNVNSTCDEQGRLQEVSLEFTGRTVHLKAGEVYEERHDRLCIRDRDESVLVFLSSDARQRTIFNSPTYGIESTGLT